MIAAPDESRAALLATLFELFRAKTYDGVSIGDVSAATGLGRSSLYHHFPGGKAQMAQAVVASARAAIGEAILAPLAAEGEPASRLLAMIEGARRLYAGRPCVLASLMTSDANAAFGAPLKGVFAEWLAAIAGVYGAMNLEPQDARREAAALLALIQGGLVLARAAGEPNLFDAVLDAAADRIKTPRAP